MKIENKGSKFKENKIYIVHNYIVGFVLQNSNKGNKIYFIFVRNKQEIFLNLYCNKTSK